MRDVIDPVNLSTMHTKSAVDDYYQADYISKAEVACLDRVAQEIHGKNILESGVGGGRTVKPLMKISKNYVGIDNSKEMLSAAKKRHPGVDLRHCDARNMVGIPDESIHLAMFSCNGIGMVSHEDRLRIFKEVYRVLVRGGVFLFSNHNQNSPEHDQGFQFPRFNKTKHPVRFVVHTVDYLDQLFRRVYNRYHLRRLELRMPDYSIINDVSHNYGVMLYHIALKNQLRQLSELGFDDNVEAFDHSGSLIRNDTMDHSIAYIARKPV